MKIAYNNSTGEIVACGTHIDHMSSADISLIEGNCTPGFGYVRNNQIVPYTNKQLQQYNTKPKYTAVWDNSTMSWRDSRSESEIRNEKYLEIKSMANFTDFSNIIIDGKEYNADQNSRNIISQKLLISVLLDTREQFFIDWSLVDNTTVELNFEGLKYLLSQIENRSTRIYNKRKELKQLIFTTNINNLNSIKWPDFI